MSARWRQEPRRPMPFLGLEEQATRFEIGCAKAAAAILAILGVMMLCAWLRVWPW